MATNGNGHAHTQRMPERGGLVLPVASSHRQKRWLHHTAKVAGCPFGCPYGKLQGGHSFCRGCRALDKSGGYAAKTWLLGVLSVNNTANCLSCWVSFWVSCWVSLSCPARRRCPTARRPYEIAGGCAVPSRKLSQLVATKTEIFSQRFAENCNKMCNFLHKFLKKCTKILKKCIFFAKNLEN